VSRPATVPKMANILLAVCGSYSVSTVGKIGRRSILNTAINFNLCFLENTIISLF